MIVIPDTKIKIYNSLWEIPLGISQPCVLGSVQPCCRCQHPININKETYQTIEDSTSFDFTITRYICLECKRESKLKSILHED